MQQDWLISALKFIRLNLGILIVSLGLFAILVWGSVTYLNSRGNNQISQTETQGQISATATVVPSSAPEAPAAPQNPKQPQELVAPTSKTSTSPAPTATASTRPRATTSPIKPTPSPTPKPILTQIPTASPVATSSARPIVKATIKPTATPSAKLAEKPKATATPMATTRPVVSPKPTIAPTPTPILSATPSARPTAIPTIKPTATPTAKPTPKPTPKPTIAPKPSEAPQAMTKGGLPINGAPEITPIAPTQKGGNYTVIKGDSSWKLAQKFYGNGYKYVEIEKANNLKHNQHLEIGQVLNIPEKQTVEAKSAAPTAPEEVTTKGGITLDSQAPAASGQTYTVKAGDSLWTIAAAQLSDSYSWSEIYRLNKQTVGSNPGLIYPGQKLELPKAFQTPLANPGK